MAAELSEKCPRQGRCCKLAYCLKASQYDALHTWTRQTPTGPEQRLPTFLQYAGYLHYPGDVGRASQVKYSLYQDAQQYNDKSCYPGPLLISWRLRASRLSWSLRSRERFPRAARLLMGTSLL